MRIVFMGTPDFAERSLKELYDQNFEVAAVFTQPDKPKNRGHKLTASPVKELALSHGTPVYQPGSLKDDGVYELLCELKPDLIAVVAYGKLLPKCILDLPRLGCINIHGSLLPKYRGSAPIQWSVLNGDRYAGVSAMFMGEEMDAGDVIDSVSTEIKENETAGELYARLADVGAVLLCDTIRAVSEGRAVRTPQDPALVSFAPPLSKEMSPIDFGKTASQIISQINGLNPWPVATTEIAGTQYKVFTAVTAPRSSGEIAAFSEDKLGIRVCCADADIIITELQVSGGKRMKASDYLRGHPLNR